jgi:hypothetical protein
VSQFLGAGDPTLGYIAADDRRNFRAEGIVERAATMRRLYLNRWRYEQPFWVLPEADFYGDSATDTDMLGTTGRWARSYRQGNAASRVGFVGVTRDQYGVPVGGVTVQLFRTSDDVLMMELVSDVNGNFLLQSVSTGVGHYIVAYKSGSPDIFGTTVNTLIGA